MRVAATSQLGPQAGFESSAVLSRRGCLYFWAEGVRGPSDSVSSLRGQRPARTWSSRDGGGDVQSGARLPPGCNCSLREGATALVTLLPLCLGWSYHLGAPGLRRSPGGWRPLLCGSEVRGGPSATPPGCGRSGETPVRPPPTPACVPSPEFFFWKPCCLLLTPAWFPSEDPWAKVWVSLRLAFLSELGSPEVQ